MAYYAASPSTTPQYSTGGVQYTTGAYTPYNIQQTTQPPVYVSEGQPQYITPQQQQPTHGVYQQPSSGLLQAQNPVYVAQAPAQQPSGYSAQPQAYSQPPIVIPSTSGYQQQYPAAQHQPQYAQASQPPPIVVPAQQPVYQQQQSQQPPIVVPAQQPAYPQQQQQAAHQGYSAPQQSGYPQGPYHHGQTPRHQQPPVRRQSLPTRPTHQPDYYPHHQQQQRPQRSGQYGRQAPLGSGPPAVRPVKVTHSPHLSKQQQARKEERNAVEDANRVRAQMNHHKMAAYERQGLRG